MTLCEVYFAVYNPGCGAPQDVGLSGQQIRGAGVGGVGRSCDPDPRCEYDDGTPTRIANGLPMSGSLAVSQSLLSVGLMTCLAGRV
jgi:hypothetical protein